MSGQEQREQLELYAELERRLDELRRAGMPERVIRGALDRLVNSSALQSAMHMLAGSRERA